MDGESQTGSDRAKDLLDVSFPSDDLLLRPDEMDLDSLTPFLFSQLPTGACCSSTISQCASRG